MRILTGPGATWIRVRPHRIGPVKAQRAHVKRDFRFVVLHGSANLCVKKVVAFNKDGDRIEKTRVPCES